MNHSATESRQHHQRPDVLTVGESMLTVRPGPNRDAFEWEVSGAESNVARYCAALGLQAAWVSQLGTDLAGDLVLSVIQAAGVDVSGVRRSPERQTGLMIKEVSASERRVRYYRTGSAASAMAGPMHDELGRDPRILHLTGITLGLSTTCRELIRSLVEDRTHASTISFDINRRPAIWNGADAPEALRDAANRCDIVFVGLDEARDLWGASTADAVRALLPQPETLIVKDGGNGAYADVLGRSYHVPALSGPVIEPVGAGDAFAAGVLAGRVRDGDNVEAWLRLGHITAMSALAQHNDVGPLADDHTTNRLLNMSSDEWRSATLNLVQTAGARPESSNHATPTKR